MAKIPSRFISPKILSEFLSWIALDGHQETRGEIALNSNDVNSYVKLFFSFSAHLTGVLSCGELQAYMFITVYCHCCKYFHSCHNCLDVVAYNFATIAHHYIHVCSCLSSFIKLLESGEEPSSLIKIRNQVLCQVCFKPNSIHWNIMLKLAIGKV